MSVDQTEKAAMARYYLLLKRESNSRLVRRRGEALLRSDPLEFR